MKRATCLHAAIVEAPFFNKDIESWDYWRSMDITTEALYVLESEEVVLIDGKDEVINDRIEAFICGMEYTGIEVTIDRAIVVVPYGEQYNSTLVEQLIKQHNYLEAE